MQTSNLSLKACACTLNRAFGGKPSAARELVSLFGGDIKAFFNLSEKERFNCLGPFSKFRKELGDDAYYRNLKELEDLGQKGWDFVVLGEEGYPLLLEDCPDAPMGLYFKSRNTPSEVFGAQNSFISIVGTRDISENGRSWSRRVVFSLADAEQKPTVVSGLAYGTDSCVHTAALESALATIAVLPCGPGEIYPRGNYSLARKIAESEGSAIVSDFPPGTPVQKSTFLRRNRIIAGISEATVVVESRRKGGSLITANLADSYGRMVYALPGRIDDPKSEGCNRLIGAKVAEPVCTPEELPRILGLGEKRSSPRKRLEILLNHLYEGEEGRMAKQAALLISTSPGIDIEALADKLHLSFSAAAGLAGMLESAGIIRTDLLGSCHIEENIQK